MLAAIILLVINRDILLSRTGGEHPVPAFREYRAFLLSVLSYYLIDILWGLMDELHVTALMHGITSLYFVIMAASILHWSRFVTAYLDDSTSYERLKQWITWGILAFQITAVGINLFRPVMFWFDGDQVYHAGPLRYITLGLQILMFILSSVHALSVCLREHSSRHSRQWTIVVFGFAMAGILGLQLVFPLLPLYSAGFMVGTCILHSFVIEEEKAEAWRMLEESVKREREQATALNSARHLAYTDALTGVRSKLAYTNAVAEKNRQIRAGETGDFAVAVFDLDGLKQINDTMGHDMGDRYIREASRMICETFSHSPVFRIGGDEFVAFLEHRDYDSRAALRRSFMNLQRVPGREVPAMVSIGISEYIPVYDTDVQEIFSRADHQMYLIKHG